MSLRDRLNKLETGPPPGDDGPTTPRGFWDVLCGSPIPADATPAERAFFADMLADKPPTSARLEAEIARAALPDDMTDPDC